MSVSDVIQKAENNEKRQAITFRWVKESGVWMVTPVDDVSHEQLVADYERGYLGRVHVIKKGGGTLEYIDVNSHVNGCYKVVK